MNDVGAHRIAALWHHLRRRRDRSLAHQRVILEREPADFNALIAVITDLMHMGRHREALDTARRALAAEPNHFLALRYAACTAVKLDLYDEAKGYAERSLDVAPDIRARMGELRVLDGIYRMLHWIGRQRHPRTARDASPDVPSVVAAKDLECYTEWARRYLDWHQRTVAGSSSPIRN